MAMGAHTRARRHQGSCGEGAAAAALEQRNAEGGVGAVAGAYAGPPPCGLGRCSSASVAFLPVVDTEPHRQLQQQQRSQLKDSEVMHGTLHASDTAASAPRAAAHEDSYLSRRAEHLQVATVGFPHQTVCKQRQCKKPFVPRQLAACKPARGVDSSTGRSRSSCGDGASASVKEQQIAGIGTASMARANNHPGGQAQGLSRSLSASAASLPVVDKLERYRQLQQQPQQQSELRDPGVGGHRAVAGSVLVAETAHNVLQQGEGPNTAAQRPCDQQHQRSSASVLETAELPLQHDMGPPIDEFMAYDSRRTHMPEASVSTSAGGGAACVSAMQQKLQEPEKQQQSLLQQPQAPQQQSQDSADVAGLPKMLQELTVYNSCLKCDSAQPRHILHAEAGAQLEAAAAAGPGSQQCKQCGAHNSNASGLLYCNERCKLRDLASALYALGNSSAALPVRQQENDPRQQQQQQQQQQSQGKLQQQGRQNSNLSQLQLGGLLQLAEQQQQGAVSRSFGRQAAQEAFSAGGPGAAIVPKDNMVGAATAGGKRPSAAVAQVQATGGAAVCQQKPVAARAAHNSTADEAAIETAGESPNSPQHWAEAQDASDLASSQSQQRSKRARRMITPGFVKADVAEAAVFEGAGVLAKQSQGSLDLTFGARAAGVGAVCAPLHNPSPCATVVGPTGGEHIDLAGAKGSSSSSIVSAENRSQGSQAAAECAMNAVFCCSLGKAVAMHEHQQHPQQAAAEEAMLPDWVRRVVVMPRPNHQQQQQQQQQHQQLVKQCNAVPAIAASAAATAGDAPDVTANGHAAAVQPGDSSALTGILTNVAGPAVPAVAPELTADGMAASQQQAKRLCPHATTQQHQQQQQLVLQQDQDQSQQAGVAVPQQQQETMQDLQQDISQPTGPPSVAGAAAAAIDKAGASNAVIPHRLSKRGKAPWGPDLLGVPLGCPTCRHAPWGCWRCRTKARRILAQQQQQGTACMQPPAAQQAADMKQQAVPAATGASLTAHDTAAAGRLSKRTRLLPAAPGTEEAIRKKGLAEAKASGTRLGQKQGASSGAAAVAVNKSKRKRAHDNSSTRPNTQLVPHTAKQQQQRQQSSVQQQGALPTAPGSQPALQQIAHQLWLPQLLQCQAFYQDCPKCKETKCPVRWFDVLHPSNTHCDGCCPLNAVKLGRTQQQQQLAELIQQAKQQQRPLLLPLISTSRTVHRDGRLVATGALNPADMVALSVQCTDVKIKLRNQGNHVAKQIIHLQPGAAGLRKQQGCATCEQLQQQPDTEHNYCSLVCKLQQAGVEAFVVDEGAAVTHQRGPVKHSVSNQQQKQEAARRQGSKQQQKQHSPAEQLLSKQQQQLVADTGCNGLSWLTALLQCTDLQQQCTKSSCQLVTNKVRTVVRHLDLSSASSSTSNRTAVTYCDCCCPDAAGMAGGSSSSSSGELEVPQLQQGQPLLLTLHSSGRTDPLQKAAADPDDLQQLGADVSDVNPIKRDTGSGTRRTLLMIHSAPKLRKDDMCRSCQVISGRGTQYQYCSLACKLRQAGLQAFIVQQGVQQQRPAGAPPGAVGAAALSPTPRRYKFPPLRLSGPQATWNLDAWQERQQAGLATLAELYNSQQRQQKQQEEGPECADNTAGNTTGTTTAAAVAHAGAASAEDAGGGTRAALSQQTSGPALAAAAAAGSSAANVSPATAVLQLVHDTGCPTAAIWQAWQSSHVSPSNVRLFCHVKQGVDVASAQFAGRSMVQQCMLNTRVNAKWGDTSLVQAFLDSLSEVLLCCNVLQTAAITAAQGEPAAEATGADHATSLLLTTAAATAEPAMPAAQQEEQAAGHGADGCIAAVHAAVAAEQSLVAGTACSLGSVDCEQRAQEAPAAAGTEQQLQKQPGGSSARTANCIDAVSVPAAAAACSAQPAATAATGLRHILLVSGTDVPVKLLPAGALPAGVTLYGSYDYPKDHVADLQEVMYEGMLEAGFGHIDARKWTSCLVPHHQWMCVSLEHALVLVSMRGVILKVASAVHAAWQEANCGIAADEYVLLTALRVAGCVKALKPCRTPAQINTCQPGIAANCHPTQVMYPAPQRWLQQLQQDKHIDTASTQAAADAAVEQSPGPSAEGKAQQAVNNTVSTGGICGAPVLNDLRFASFTADKHPVAWRAVKEVIWCEDEEEDTAYAVKLTLQHLLAIAAERGCLALRKVDCGEDRDARNQVLRLLQKTWLGDAPKVRFMKRVEMVQ